MLLRSITYTTLVFAFCFFFHEFGHYIAYRIVGVIPKTFSIGMGPSICSYTDCNGTQWQIAPIPIGAYVETPLVKISRTATIFTALAGPLANFVTGFILMSSLIMYSGCTYVSHNNRNYVCVKSVSDAIGYNRVLRVGVEYDAIPTDGGTYDQNGVRHGHMNCTLSDACAISAKFFIKQVVGLKTLVLNLTKGFKKATTNLSGPVGIIRIAAASHSLSYALFLASQIAFALGVFNLLPIPPLDGGRILFALFNVDPMEENFATLIFFGIGFALLAILMVVLLWQDLSRIFWR